MSNITEELQRMILAQAAALAEMRDRYLQAEQGMSEAWEEITELRLKAEEKEEEIHDLQEAVNTIFEERKALYTALGCLHAQDAAIGRISYLLTKEAAYDKQFAK